MKGVRYRLLGTHSTAKSSKVGSQSRPEVEVKRPSSSEFSCLFIGSGGIFQDLASTSCI